MTPRVSIVIAAKNYGRFLTEAVESVLAQTFADWELLIIDDGSTDDTQMVAARFRDSRIRCVKSDRLGQSRAKNLGIDLACGEFIAFLDADDAWMPMKLERQLALFADGVGVVFSRRSLMDEASRPLHQKPYAEPARGEILSKLYTLNFVCFSSVIVRREVFSRVGRFDPQWDLAIDYDLWLRVARHFRFDFVDEELVRYRTGHGNLSKKLADRVDGVLSIMHRNSDAVPERVRADGFAATCRTIGYVMRGSEPDTAMKWYLRAFREPSRRLLSVKGLLGSVAAWMRGRREPGSAENASVNI